MIPDVSIVLPFRDVAGTLEEAMRSVLPDAGMRAELLAIDDGSTDGSTKIAERIDPRVRVLSSGGRGLVAALELGRTEARAPLIARMDGDDISLTGRLEAQAALLAREPSVAAVGGWVEAFPEASVGEGLARYVAWQNALVTPEEHARDAFVEATLCHPSAMLRAAALNAVGGYREGPFAEDWDLWLRLHAAGFALGKVQQQVLRWRHREGRATFSDPRYGEAAHRGLRAEHLAPRLRAVHPRRLTMWGAGPVARRLARALETHGVAFARFVEIDPRRIGGTCRGAPIIGAEALTMDDYVVAAVGARGARDLIRAELLGRGFLEGRDFVCAA